MPDSKTFFDHRAPQNVPYVFVPSKAALGRACGVSRPVIACRCAPRPARARVHACAACGRMRAAVVHPPGMRAVQIAMMVQLRGGALLQTVGSE